MLSMTIQRVLPSGGIEVICDSLKGYYIGYTITGAVAMFRQEFHLEHKKIHRARLPDRHTTLHGYPVSDIIVCGGNGYVVGEIQGSD